MIRSFERLFVTVVVALVLGWTSEISGAVDSPGERAWLISVFDCYMPIPDEFVLNTRETNRIMLFHRSLFDAMMITISEFQTDLGSNFLVVSEHESGGLRIEELRNTVRKEIRVARIHDRIQQVMLYGGNDTLIESLVQGCLSNKREDTFSN